MLKTRERQILAEGGLIEAEAPRAQRGRKHAPLKESGLGKVAPVPTPILPPA